VLKTDMKAIKSAEVFRNLCGKTPEEQLINNLSGKEYLYEKIIYIDYLVLLNGCARNITLKP
jgi:hypothetical protein